MSRQNKVNPSQYQIAGRLTPDDLARERVKQRNVAPADAASEGGAPRPAAAYDAQETREKGAAGVPSLLPAKTRSRGGRR